MLGKRKPAPHAWTNRRNRYGPIAREPWGELRLSILTSFGLISFISILTSRFFDPDLAILKLHTQAQQLDWEIERVLDSLRGFVPTFVGLASSRL